MWVYFSVSTSDKVITLNSIQSWIAVHGLNIIIILVGAWLLRRFGSVFFRQLFRKTIRHDLFPTETDRKKRIATLNSLVDASMKISVWVISMVMIISELGVNTAPLIASAGVMGVALGFGAQSLIKDFVSGVFIITENQYRVGDIVKLGTLSGVLGNVSGTIEAITIRTTVVRDIEGNLCHIPNGSINVTVNKTMGYSKLNEDLVVGAGTDIDQLEHLINHVGEQLSNSPETQSYIKEIPKMTSINGFTEDGLSVKIQGKVTAGDQWKVKTELYRKLKKSLINSNITVAKHTFSTDKKKPNSQA